MPILFGINEAAEQLGRISPWTLRAHISKGHIHVVRIGKRIFLDADELARIRREGLPSLRNGVSAVREEESCPAK